MKCYSFSLRMLCWLGNRFEEIVLSELTSQGKYLHYGRLWLVSRVFPGVTNYSSAAKAGRGIGSGGCAWQLSCCRGCCLLACDPLLESSQPALGAQTEFLPLYNVHCVSKLSCVHLSCPKPVFCAESHPGLV